MITIVDYGLGNIKAFTNVYERLNIPISISRSAADLKNATKIILPGVGAFDYAVTKLNISGMREVLDDRANNKSVSILGVCVGMQIMARSSEEGTLPGLGWFDAAVKKFDASSRISATQLPHMGWNTIFPNNGNPLLKGFDNNSRFYFLHSYYFKCNNQNNVIAHTDYGIQYASAVNHNNIYGVQFHPEKSHQWGTQLLKNFAEL
jgi:glutamine amidotransferase